MALTIVDFLRAINPNIGLVVNPGGSFRIGVEDINSDEILAALQLIQDNPITTNTTGNGVAVATLAPGAAFKLLQVRFHLASALAAAETLTITNDILAAAIYDTVIFNLDMGTAGLLDVVVEFGDGYDYVAGDQIVIALSANAGADVWGCQTIHKLI